MLRLQELGCHNINFVTPSHVVPQILEALVVAAERGLRLPLVYNTGGYDRLETLRWLDGVVDIYMPDFKFWNPETAQELAKAADYPEVARAAIKEMHRQVGDLVLDDHGLARRGAAGAAPGDARRTGRDPRDPAVPGRGRSRRTRSSTSCRSTGPRDWRAGIRRSPGRWRREFREAVAIAREEGLRRLARG